MIKFLSSVKSKILFFIYSFEKYNSENVYRIAQIIKQIKIKRFKMSFNIEVIEEKKNPLIDRLELKFRIDHVGESTPNRLEVKKKIAAMQGVDEKLTIIRKLDTHFGALSTVGKACIYENSKDLQYFEPFHIQVRNLEKDKRTELYQLKKRKEPYKHLFEY